MLTCALIIMLLGALFLWFNEADKNWKNLVKISELEMALAHSKRTIGTMGIRYQNLKKSRRIK